MKAALFVGGWEGHAPSEFSDWYAALLRDNGFEVDIHDTLAPLDRPGDLADLDLITPIWSSARSGHREEFGNMTKTQEDGLLQLVGQGCGLAGWHGHMGDAFRDRPTYHFLIGGQFVAHPPGWPDNLQPREDYVDYDVTICRPDDPIVRGIRSFRLTSEQYYMLVDPPTRCWPPPPSPAITCGGSRAPSSPWCGNAGGTGGASSTAPSDTNWPT